MAYRYTDPDTRTVYRRSGGFGDQQGKTAQFWADEAGTVPIDVGLYSESTPSTPGASTGANTLQVRADQMWPAMWDRVGANPHMWIQVGTVSAPGDLYKVFPDADQLIGALAEELGGLGGASALDVGTTPGTVAAGNDPRLTRVIDPMDPIYGAVGDGSTDDAVAVQAALNAVPAAGGCVLFRPGKTFIIGSHCTVKANTTIIGYGATLKAKSGTNGVRLLYASETTGGVVVQGLTLDLNKSSTTDPAATTAGIGLYFHSSNGFAGHAVRDCVVKNSHPQSPGIRFSTGQSAVTDPDNLSAASFTVENCRFVDCGRAIYASYVTDARIVNNEVVTTSTDAITVSVGARPYIAGNRVSGAGKHGIIVEYVKRAQIAGNSCSGSTQWGISVGGGSTTLAPNLHVAVNGNICIGNGRGGIIVDPTKVGALDTPVKTDVVLAGNVCSFGGLFHGIYLNNVDGSTICGNACNGNPDSGIAVTGRNAAVSGNTCQSNGINGISLYYASGPDHGHHNIGVNNVLGNTVKGYHRSAGLVDIVFAETNPPRVTSVASSTTPTPDIDGTDFFVLSALAAPATFAAPTGTPFDAQDLTFRIKDDGNARTLAWNAAYRAVGVTLPATTSAGKMLYVEFRYNAAAGKWDAISVRQEA